MVLHPGDAVDRYVVEDVLGEGRVATVYRVRHAALGTVHALKVLDDVTSRDRFMDEARIQAGLRHPNLVPVTDVLLVEGHPALLAEFVGGGSLRSRLARELLPLREAERLFRQILDGVAHAHKEGMIHRDLRPENVVLDDAGATVTARVTDFGLARLLVDATGRPRRTRTGETLGSPAYMAPEQTRSFRAADARSDIFSLGAILYEMLCGRPPFPVDDFLAAANRAANAEYAPPAQIRPGTPERLLRAISGALQPDADRRIPDCDALLAVLDGMLFTGARAPDRPEVPVTVTAPLASLRSPTSARAVVVDQAGRGHLVEVVVELAPELPAPWNPQALSAEARAAAELALAAGLGASRGVRWQLRGEGFELDGPSLGLALAISARAARDGLSVPSDVAFTGAVDLDGAVRRVGSLPEKIRAAARAELTRIFTPADAPETVGGALQVRPVSTFGEVCRELGWGQAEWGGFLRRWMAVLGRGER